MKKILKNRKKLENQILKNKQGLIQLQQLKMNNELILFNVKMLFFMVFMMRNVYSKKNVRNDMFLKKMNVF
jgi:hypothetical protein